PLAGHLQRRHDDVELLVQQTGDQVVPLVGCKLALRLDALAGLLCQLHLEACGQPLAVEIIEGWISALGRDGDLEGGRRGRRLGGRPLLWLLLLLLRQSSAAKRDERQKERHPLHAIRRSSTALRRWRPLAVAASRSASNSR